VYELKRRVEQLTRMPSAVHQRFLDAMAEIQSLKQRVAELEEGGQSAGSGVRS
jgi:hypothetical protein